MTPTKPTSLILALTASLVLSGCMGSGTSAQLATAQAARSNAQAGPAIVEEDLERSCADLTASANALYARHKEIVRAANAKQTRNNILGGLAGAGIGILGGNAILGSGSVSAMRGAQAATAAAQMGADAALSNADPTSLKDITNVTTLTNRAAQIERAKLQKQC